MRTWPFCGDMATGMVREKDGEGGCGGASLCRAIPMDMRKRHVWAWRCSFREDVMVGVGCEDRSGGVEVFGGHYRGVSQFKMVVQGRIDDVDCIRCRSQSCVMILQLIGTTGRSAHALNLRHMHGTLYPIATTTARYI